RIGHRNHLARSLARTPRPGLRRLWDASGLLLFVPGEHEQQQAEAVQPATHLRVVEAALVLEGEAATLGPTRDRPCKVHGRGGGRRARKYESVWHADRLLELGHHLLQALNAGRRRS